MKITILLAGEPGGFLQWVQQHSLPIMLGMIMIFVCVLAWLVYTKHVGTVNADRMFALAYIDNLTGIWNGNYFTEEAGRQMDMHDKSDEKKIAIISMDIGKFRAINENFGRFVGDDVLRHVANAIRSMKDMFVVYARPGKDHFYLLTKVKDEKEALEMLQEFRKRCQHYSQSGVELKLHFQCGIYIVDGYGIDIFNAIDMAEVAKKQAKEEGRDTDSVFDKRMEQKILDEKEIEDCMEKALKNGEFKVYYQPKYDMSSNSIIGAEALIRWFSPIRGFMRPDEFIPVFERNGFVIEVDFFVLEEVCKLIRHWLDINKIPIIISVNMSRLHLNNPNYIDRVMNLINKYNVPTGAIELEITENSFMSADATMQVLSELQTYGFKVSMDDFGSGYSSLNVLKSLQLDVLKIDKEFLNESTTSDRAKSIIKKVVEMSKELEMEVICEGVENEDQAEFLLSIGCQYAQGFLYAKPMVLEDFEGRVKKQWELPADTDVQAVAN